jgi:hypothetical protein
MMPLCNLFSFGSNHGRRRRVLRTFPARQVTTNIPDAACQRSGRASFCRARLVSKLSERHRPRPTEGRLDEPEITFMTLRRRFCLTAARRKRSRAIARKE